MLVWNQQLVSNIDTSDRQICKNEKMKLLDRSIHKFSIILVQCLSDFTVILPVLLTGNIVKMKIDNLCFVSFDRLDLVFTMSALTFVVSDMVLAVLCHRLAMYVRQASSRVNGNQWLRIQRDSTMVRCIVLLNAQLCFVGSPTIVVIVLNTICNDILLYGSMRIVFIIMNLALTFLTIVLCRNTTHLRRSVFT
ncbi:unnamed protein product [Rotaria magnacalcarata]|uniref:G-protein coupled receptors family 1 profile domain-containing protein n=1 Tax=Rotaria magnacalcarata TaxID=392030 RepID=A0A816LJD5_9BILA|nr:unnamed protein product [Rotaria magnacalcarata]CAF4200877.1 unnamed protein product [Rotaria magnacalcarata]